MLPDSELVKAVDQLVQFLWTLGCTAKVTKKRPQENLGRK